MKHFIIVILFISIPVSLFSQNNNVGIGTSYPDSSAVLDIQSIDQGILLPRMDSSSRMAILNPKDGLILYDSTTYSFWFYRNTSWTQLEWRFGDDLGNHVAIQDLDLDGQRIINLDDPQVNGDAVNKFYVDQHQDGDSNPINEIQLLSISNDTVYLSSGGFVKLPPSSGVFENNNGVVSNSGSNDDDFIFGNSVLPPNGLNASGRLFFFDEGKAAFRAGRLNNSNAWASDSLGIQSTALGFNIKARGTNSFAAGSNSEANFTESIAIGKGTKSNAEGAISIGSSNQANGIQSVAIGSSTLANGTHSTTLGRSTRADGNDAIAMGYDTEADGDYSTAMGYLTEANGLLQSCYWRPD